MKATVPVLSLLVNFFVATAFTPQATAQSFPNGDMSAGTVKAEKSDRRSENGKKHDGFRRLGLDKDQQARIKEIRQQSRDEVKTKKASLKEAREKLKTAMKSNASDQELETLFEQTLTLQQEMSRLRFKKMISVRAVLTPEQREKFNALREVWGKKGHGHHE